jgi:glutamate-1-semialdehyde 2,1-aminomutase
VAPDITCLGKIIGGGFPVGAYGASAEIMQTVAPLGAMYQAGTLSGNPVAMAAGIATLELLKQPGTYETLAQNTHRLAAGMGEVFAEAGVPATVNSVCGAFTVFFNQKPVVDMTTAGASDMRAFARFFHAMLEHGVYLPPSGYEAWFVSLAHTDSDIDATLDAARQSLMA